MRKQRRARKKERKKERKNEKAKESKKERKKERKNTCDLIDLMSYKPLMGFQNSIKINFPQSCDFHVHLSNFNNSYTIVIF